MRIEDLGRVRFPESMEEALSKINPNGHDAVSYTHLTLPTIRLV